MSESGVRVSGWDGGRVSGGFRRAGIEVFVAGCNGPHQRFTRQPGCTSCQSRPGCACVSGGASASPAFSFGVLHACAPLASRDGRSVSVSDTAGFRIWGVGGGGAPRRNKRTAVEPFGPGSWSNSTSIQLIKQIWVNFGSGVRQIAKITVKNCKKLEGIWSWKKQNPDSGKRTFSQLDCCRVAIGEGCFYAIERERR